MEAHPIAYQGSNQTVHVESRIEFFGPQSKNHDLMSFNRLE